MNLKSHRYGTAAAFAVFMAAIGLLCTACTTTVGEIGADPGAYQDKTVLLRGEVTESIAVPLIDQSVSLFSDGTGKALLISVEPFPEDSELTIEGRVLAFPEQRTKEAVDEATERLSRALVDAGMADTDAATRISAPITKVASRLADRLGALFLIVHEP
jgi:hypothetical protein